MNVTLAFGLCGVVVHALIASFFYGILTQKVTAHEVKLTKLETKSDDHEKRITILEQG